MRAQLTEAMALDESELPAVSTRLKDLRAELARVRGVREVSQYAVAHEMGKAPRTFQSWENGEVEPRGPGYGPLADYYTEQLGRKITKNWIMFGQEEVPAMPAPTPDVLDKLNPSEATVDALRQEVEALRFELLAELAAAREAQAAVLRRLPPEGWDWEAFGK